MAYGPAVSGLGLVLVEFAYQYEGRDGTPVSIKPNERYVLLAKTNDHWWHVRNDQSSKSFYIPAKYVKELPANLPSPLDFADPPSPEPVVLSNSAVAPVPDSDGRGEERVPESGGPALHTPVPPSRGQESEQTWLGVGGVLDDGSSSPADPAFVDACNSPNSALLLGAELTPDKFFLACTLLLR
uniref:SH3 domain-containing protein n=1 Tax=Oryzias sinensis TaxID=183150 RepID=A0A8C7WTU0_9TELE